MKNRYQISLNFTADIVVNTDSDITEEMIDNNMDFVKEIRQYIIDKTGFRTSGSIKVSVLADDDEIDEDTEEIEI